MNAPEAENLVEAIKEELDAHEQNNTWTQVPREKDRKPIDSKWVFKVKQNVSGDVYRYKARLCARGFQQKEGLDYTETFSPVVRYDSLRVLLALVAEKDLELVQFDVRTAFLHGELKEEIYMEVPEGLNIVEGRKYDVVCKLNKSFYGLKQAPRCWNEGFYKFLQKFSLRETEADKCLFSGSVNGSEVFLALFVDDGLITAESSQVLESVIKSLEKEFEITTGNGEIFVGVQTKRDRANKMLFLHKEAYTKKILSRFKMSESKAVSIPADPNVKLMPNEKDKNEPSNIPFREAVGSSMFLAVKGIFGYLIGTTKLGILYTSGGSMLELVGFSDSDFASDPETRRSTTGYAFCKMNVIISWASQRQRVVTLSATEAEYVAVATAAKEALWLRKLLRDLGCETFRLFLVLYS